jgi:hypothetical protein
LSPTVLPIVGGKLKTTLICGRFPIKLIWIKNNSIKEVIILAAIMASINIPIPTKGGLP